MTRLAPTLCSLTGSNNSGVRCIRRALVVAAGLYCMFPGAGRAVADLTELSIESLMEMQVTSPARRLQDLSEVAAAVTVITREDIRRAGITNVAEAMRLAPGVDVERTNSSSWAVGVRGINGFVSNKLLVLIDGRVIYNPIYAGVTWRQFNLPMDDIERIEVIRGPGGTLWGANAVNGVINIITRHAADTHGTVISATGGDHEGGSVRLRHGGRLGESLDFRIDGRYANHGSLDTTTGASARDGWEQAGIGARLDWSRSDEDHFTLQGDFNSGNQDQRVQLASLAPPGNFLADDQGSLNAGNVLARWQHETHGGNQLTTQVYFDSFHFEDAVGSQSADTWDLDLQYQARIGARFNLLSGAGYRHIGYEVEPRFASALSPPGDDLDLYSAFLQGELDLTPRLRLIAGSKFEHNEFTGFEYQPNIRLLWQPADGHSFWAAVSRAVRTPTPADRNARVNVSVLPGTPPVLVSLFGSPEVQSERLVAYELGYRGQLLPTLSLDATAFYNDYDRVADRLEPVAPALEIDPLPPHVLLAFVSGNVMKGETYGLEAALEWRPYTQLRIAGSYSLIRVAMHGAVPGIVPDAENELENGDPQQQFQLRAYLDPVQKVELGAALFWVDRLAADSVNAYFRLDMHAGWRPVPKLGLDLFLQNLLHAHHLEEANSTGGLFVVSEIPRAVFGRVTWEW